MGWGPVVGKELVNIEAMHILLDAQLSKQENTFLSDREVLISLLIMLVHY